MKPWIIFYSMVLASATAAAVGLNYLRVQMSLQTATNFRSADAARVLGSSLAATEHPPVDSLNFGTGPRCGWSHPQLPIDCAAARGPVPTLVSQPSTK